jgi:Domain of unknown function (DUF222)
LNPHPVVACATSIIDELKNVRDVEVTFMETTDKRDALLLLAKAAARIEGLRMRVLANAADVAQDEGYRDAGQWLAHRTRDDRTSARRDLRLAKELDRRWTGIAEALADGRINLAQAEAIARGLADLPASSPHDLLLRAEEHLVNEAGSFGPRELRLLARRVLDVLAPEIADEHERRLLEAEEREACKRTSLVSHRNGDGTTTIRLRVPDAVATRLNTYLTAYTSPRRNRLTEPADPSAVPRTTGSNPDAPPYDVQLGQAFSSLLEHIDPKRLPLHGGDATTVVVTVGLDSLQQGLGTATLGDGSSLTPGATRRLACNAAILPAVLGGDSEILDLGRTKRLFTPAQRRALRIRDKRCRAEGCDISAEWTEAHHLTPWQAGGRTDLANGILLCPFHHHLIHDPTYHHTRVETGEVRFRRRRR